MPMSGVQMCWLTDGGTGDTGRASFPVAGKVEVVCQVMAVGVVFRLAATSARSVRMCVSFCSFRVTVSPAW